MSNSSIWPIDKTLSSTITPDQSGPESDGSEGVLRIPQNSSITGASPLNGLMSYQDIRWGSYPYTKMQSVYFTAPAD